MLPNNIANSAVLKVALTVAAAAGILLLLSTSRFFLPKEEKVPAPPLQKPEEVVYQTYKTQKTVIENSFTARGFFIAESEADVSFCNRDGYLKALYVRPGQAVSKGEIMAALDTDTLLMEIKQQTILLKGSEDNLSKVRKIADLEAQVNRLQLAELKKELETKKAQKNALRPSEIEKDETQILIREQLNGKSLLEYAHQIGLAEQEIALARIRLDTLEQELEKAIMRSPLAGKVSYVSPAHTGEFIPAWKILIRIADPGRLLLRYNGNEHGKFRTGMQVAIDITGTLYPGVVVMTPLDVPLDDFEKLKDTVHIRVPALPAAVKMNDPAVIEATLEKAENVIVLPKKLVHTYSGRIFVKVLENGIVTERDIAVGIEAPTAYEITGGLETGELVVE